MISKSLKNKLYIDFDWESYSKYYNHLKKDQFLLKEQLWWHYVNIGEKNGYRFFDLKEKNDNLTNKTLFDSKLYAEYYPFLKKYGFHSHDALWWHYIHFGLKDDYIYFNNSYIKSVLDEFVMFDDYKYIMSYPYLYDQKYQTKQELWDHYLNIGKNKGYRFFTIHQLEEDEDEEDNVNDETKDEISEKKTVYYFIDACIRHIIRSGIQVVSIYLAKELLKKKDIDVIFVKWNPRKNAIVPCHSQEIDFFFNYNESNNFIEPIKYVSYSPIHLNRFRPITNCLFFCPEVTFTVNDDVPYQLFEYLNKHSFQSCYLLYDIIPLLLKPYNIFEEKFYNYLQWNLLYANQLISISDFTKNEFENYVSEKKIDNEHLPILKSVPLPYQYRNKERIYPNMNNNEKVIILVPGMIEFRKQQILLMQLFNRFIQNDPSVDVEMIVFGNIIEVCKDAFHEEVLKSEGKIIYLGLIDNEKLSEYYKKASFSCFISLYEGFGFPISESLSHGTPVLTSNFGSMKEVASVGGCFTVDSTKEEEIYNALDILIKNPSIIHNLKQEIQNISLSNWEEYGDLILKEILSIE